jgi:Uma2 family endonuclease
MTIFSFRKDPKSYADYLAFVAERPDEERWELVDREIVLQAAPSEAHQLIVANMLGILRRFARERGAESRALPGITIAVDHVDTYAPIPDAILRCGPLTSKNVCSDPIYVVEVESPWTGVRDRGFKAEFYGVVPTIEAYVIVYSQERRVEVLTARGSEPLRRAFAGNDPVTLPGSATRFTLDEVYEGTTLTAR